MAPVWMIGLALPVAMVAATALAFSTHHPFRRPIAVGTVAGGVFWLVAWSLARAAVADESRVAEILFLQLALSTLACFVFAVATMAAARWGRMSG